MYRFKYGKFAGKTMEQVVLRSTPRLYRIAEWAEEQVEEKSRLRPLVREFQRLRKLLNRATIYARCTDPGCRKTARWMTFEQATGSGYIPFASMWCDKHTRTDPDFPSLRVPIGFEAMFSFETLEERRIVGRQVREALGIKRGTRITEGFARKFFSKIH